MCKIIDAVNAAWAENPRATDTDLSAAAVRAARETGDTVTMLVRDHHGSVHIQRANAGSAWVHLPRKQKAGP